MQHIHDTDGFVSGPDCSRGYIPRFRGTAPERVMPLLDWGLLTRSARPKTRLRPPSLSASFAMRLHRSLDELDHGSPLERLFKESDGACF